MTLKERLLRHLKAKLKQLCLAIVSILLAALVWALFFLAIAYIFGCDIAMAAMYFSYIVTFGTFPLMAILVLSKEIYDDLEKIILGI